MHNVAATSPEAVPLATIEQARRLLYDVACDRLIASLDDAPPAMKLERHLIKTRMRTTDLLLRDIRMLEQMPERDGMAKLQALREQLEAALADLVAHHVAIE